MLRYIAGRLAASIGVLFALSILCFLIVRLIPGDPVANIVDTDSATPEQIAAIREQLGLNRPWPEQYLTWLGGLLTGNLGRSLTMPVLLQEQVASRLPVTIELALIATVIAVLFGLTFGTAAAFWRGRVPDVSIRALAFLLISLPEFIAATFVVVVNSFTLRLPLLGYQSWEQSATGHLASLLVPGMLLGLGSGAVLTRYVRNSLLDALDQDYIRTARAKGASQLRLVFGHALRNSLIPVVTVVGTTMALLIGGTIVVENVFTLPGMGTALIAAMNTSDYPAIQSYVVILGAFYVLINLLVDLSYPLIDPRVRLVKK
ncbi:ABC transporter permease [Leucobacter sp. USHLN154]|uniref:ABC transporter permease n=1 Tax=Leucobacter sp. USHLN154 TaxID=3081269 RepID=UPI00301A1862